MRSACRGDRRRLGRRWCGAGLSDAPSGCSLAVWWGSSNRGEFARDRTGRRLIVLGSRDRFCGASGVLPVVEDLQVQGADRQGDQDGLGSAAVGEATLRLGEVDPVSLPASVEAFVVCPDGLADCGAAVADRRTRRSKRRAADSCLGPGPDRCCPAGPGPGCGRHRGGVHCRRRPTGRSACRVRGAPGIGMRPMGGRGSG